MPILILHNMTLYVASLTEGNAVSFLCGSLSNFPLHLLCIPPLAKTQMLFFDLYLFSSSIVHAINWSVGTHNIYSFMIQTVLILLGG